MEVYKSFKIMGLMMRILLSIALFGLGFSACAAPPGPQDNRIAGTAQPETNMAEAPTPTRNGKLHGRA